MGSGISCSTTALGVSLPAHQRDQAHLGVHLLDGVIFVRFKIDGLYDWADQAFSMGLVSEAERDVRPHVTGEYQLLNLVLV